MPEEEDQNMNTNQEEEEDFDDEEDEELEEDEDMEEYDEDEDEDLELDSPTTSSDPIPQQPSIPNMAATTPVVSTSVSTTTTTAPAIATTITTTQTGGEPEIKRQKIEEPITPMMAITTTTEERKPPSTEERKLFQRLWTDEDEIGLLQGFLEYNTKQRGTGTKNSSSYHHDTGPFYDQIKTKLQLEFNKNQLVEKLRRLKKKYRNVMSRVSSGKDLIFKTPHDQSCFEISKKIWGAETGGNVVVSGGGVEEEDGNPNPLQIVEVKNVSVGNNGGVAADINGSEKQAIPRSRKRIRKRTEVPPNVSNPSNIPVNLSVSSVIEETVKSCLSPLFKELLQSAINGPNNVRGLGVMGLNPLNLGANSSSSMNLLSGEMVDEKWKKQQVLELEVYAKRMDLVQDQIKLALEELRSTGN
ncbi:hypothetical protein MKW92_023188 [Papaver armeniacum]|nr:hypothetical protein MKW92_023188 [Papaver armeniacum]